MFKTFTAYARLTLVMIMAYIPYLWYLVLGLFNKERQNRYLHKVTALWGRVCVKLSRSNVEVTGTDKLPEGNVLYVGNHQGYYDIPLLLGYLPKPKAFVAKIELAKIPALSLWMRQMGCLFLDRGNMKQSLKVILQGVAQLKSGETMVIFPEGTRSKSYSVGEFKKGSLKLGVKAGVPIVPITIMGSYEMFEEKNQFQKRDVKIIIHDPIFPGELAKEELANLSETVRNIIIEPIIDRQ